MNSASKLKDIIDSPSPSFDLNGVITAHRVLDCHSKLGECILFDDETNKILWTDINGKTFNSLDLNDGTHKSYGLLKMLGSFALLSQHNLGSNVYLCAWEDGFQIFDIEKGIPLGPLSQGEDVNPMKLPSRLNDGRVDRAGKYFICGGYYGDIPGNYMKVFKVELDDPALLSLKHEPVVEQIQVTNSICWSLDGKTQYLADSPTQIIYQYDYDQHNGLLSNKESFRKLNVGVPDGSCIDSCGNLWNAVWRNGEGPSMVQCIDHVTKDVIYTVRMPDETSQITCVCFGGPNLDIIFISTAHINLDRQKEPNAGCIYAVKLGVKGLLEDRFKMKND
jgi:L-arabinonolactonase